MTAFLHHKPMFSFFAAKNILRDGSMDGRQESQHQPTIVCLKLDSLAATCLGMNIFSLCIVCFDTDHPKEELLDLSEQQLQFPAGKPYNITFIAT